MKQQILKSIRVESSQLLVSKAIDSAFLCLKADRGVYTDFYDPKSAALIQQALKPISDVNIRAFGGCEGAERVMLCLYPRAIKAMEFDFPIGAIYIDSSKFSKALTHRDFLGSLIGLGIDRSKLGDIFVKEGNATAFVHEQIMDYILFNLERIGNTKVKVSRLVKGEEAIDLFEAEGRLIKVTVPSMRLDAVAGEAFKLSRGKAQELIKSEKLFVNWTIANSNSQSLKEGDILSARGFGRAVIRTVGGKTKKDRIFIEIEVFR